MFLCIDCGNTRTKANIYTQMGELVARSQHKHLRASWLQKIFDAYPIQAAILCSVVAHDSDAVVCLEKNAPLITLSHTISLPVTLAYLTPETLGRDRIAVVCGAHSLYPNENILVIDAGTCIKYDFLDANATHQGGSIAPGIGMRLKAMHQFTAKLPLVERQPIGDFIGRNTETALLTGGQLGAAMEVEGFIAQYKKHFGEMRVLLTGGDAPFIQQHTLGETEHLPHLLMSGLYAILLKNLPT